MAEVKKHHWLSRLTFGTAALILSGLLLLSYCSAVVNPAKSWVFTIFGLLFIPLFLLTVLFFVWSLFRRSRMSGLLLVMLLPSLLFIGRYWQGGKEEAAPGPLKMVSYNVGLFANSDRKYQRIPLADSVAAFLMRTDADVICLQEFYLPNAEDLDDFFRTRFPGYHADYYVLTGKEGHAGNVTLSRRPVLNRGKIDFEKSTNLALYTDILLDSTVVRVYNCHFESYNISVSGLLKSLRKTEEMMEETGRKMRRSITQRPRQVDEVMHDVDNCPVRSVVLGDFNDNPLSYTYFRLSRGRKDSFVKAGRGFGATYRTLWPFLRIDYILYPPDLAADTYEVRKVKYSDHYPIIATYHET